MQGAPLAAQTTAQPGPSDRPDSDQRAPGDIVVTGTGEDNQLATPQRATTIVDTPATVNVLSDELLAQQGRTTLRDSLRNITGISYQAGEGNPPGGGDSFSVRGFSARDDILVDGMRDIGNYFRDPFIAHRIEVTKGPASAFAGRGNVGGTLNIVTNGPKLTDMATTELMVGTANLFRAFGNINLAVDEDSGTALRVDFMAHSADEPGRDVTNNRRWAIAPTLVIGMDSLTTVTINLLHQSQRNLPDYGIPNVRDLSFAGSRFFGQPAPVARNNFYGYSTDYYNVDVDTATVRIETELAEQVSLRHQSRIGHVHVFSLASAPRWYAGTTDVAPNTTVFGRGKARDYRDDAIFNQTQLTWDVGPDSFHHTLVLGAEVNYEETTNNRRLDPDGPPRNIFTPELLPGPQPVFNGTRVSLRTDTIAAYIFDTVELGTRWRIVGGARFDNVRTHVRSYDDFGIAPRYPVDLSVTDNEFSGNVGLVWKPAPDASVYIAYGTAFEPSGRSEVVLLTGITNDPPVTAASLRAGPERAASWEVGARTPLFGSNLNLSVSLFQIEKNRTRTPGIETDEPAVVTTGRQRVRGGEVQIEGEIIDQWTVFAGYTYLDGEVVRSNIPAEVGVRLDNLPRHSGNIWLSYRVLPPLMLGIGAQHVGSRRSNTVAPAGFTIVTVPAYTIADAFAEYKVSDRDTLRLNVTNLFDAYYFQAFFNNHSIPSAGRAVSLSYRHNW
jgi:catecholate siderophore receptor